MAKIWLYDENRMSGPSMSPAELSSFWSRVHQTEQCAFCSEPLVLVERFYNENAPRDYTEVYMASLSKSFRHGLAGFDSPEPELPSTSLERQEFARVYHSEMIERAVRSCPMCGWWLAFEEFYEDRHSHVRVDVMGGIGSLKALDLANVETPLDEVRQYLIAKYEARFELHPRLFEETVASVFRAVGYEARVTAYSGDGGIDVILDGPDNKTIGVQVKRYASSYSIEVEQIHALIGALVQRGITTGMFVTTSRFRRGARRAAEPSPESLLPGLRVELIDAPRFHDALKLSQRMQYGSTPDTTAPFNRLPLRHVYSHSAGRRSNRVVW